MSWEQSEAPRKRDGRLDFGYRLRLRGFISKFRPRLRLTPCGYGNQAWCKRHKRSQRRVAAAFDGGRNSQHTLLCLPAQEEFQRGQFCARGSQSLDSCLRYGRILVRQPDVLRCVRPPVGIAGTCRGLAALYVSHSDCGESAGHRDRRMETDRAMAPCRSVDGCSRAGCCDRQPVKGQLGFGTLRPNISSDETMQAQPSHSRPMQNRQNTKTRLAKPIRKSFTVRHAWFQALLSRSEERRVG